MFENDLNFDWDEPFSSDSFITSTQTTNKTKRESKELNNLPEKKQKITNISPDIRVNVVKRKFPGPAGLLPENNQQSTSNSNEQSQEIPCSQSSFSIFQDNQWLAMLQDYNKIPEKYNIKWIKLNASLNKLTNKKAPFLAAIIQNIEYFQNKTPLISFNLKDMTGEIQATIIHSLYETYCDYLTIGSVIILKQFGVLTTNNNHYLTITQNNLLTIYNKKINKEIDKIIVKQINLHRFLKEIQENSNDITNTIKTENLENSKICESAFDGVDFDLLFNDF